MQKHLFHAVIIVLLIVIRPSFAGSTETTAQPVLALPIKCTLGSNCYIMHYVDLDPGDKVLDFGCGSQTYNEHNGTDFGISDLATMKQGVAVLAAADGIVHRARDGMADRLIADQAQKKAVSNIECGNGLVIDHGHGWQTQYCHLLNGSIAVKKGNTVRKGTPLGMVGSSGLASFPHVHFTVRYQDKVVDPFVGRSSVAGCQVSRHALWENAPDYVPTGLIRAGFSPKPPAQIELWQGEFRAAKSHSSEMPALIFWVHVFGVLQGDREHFTLINPDQRVMIDQGKYLTKSNRSWVSYAGRRNTQDHPLAKGIWRGVYQLKRDDRILINLERVFIIE
jgi:murein DD-endopeptidase MepM/ murein hydrolase activator NlpD